uniref:Uncharacterized protein n=1 Tax=Meloidogyne incognita TaxID=6306 RepID=A0A914N2W8_MELIC
MLFLFCIKVHLQGSSSSTKIAVSNIDWSFVVVICKSLPHFLIATKHLVNFTFPYYIDILYMFFNYFHSFSIILTCLSHGFSIGQYFVQIISKAFLASMPDTTIHFNCPIFRHNGKLALVIDVFISFLRNNCQMVRLKMIQSKMFHTSRCYCHCILQNINSFCCFSRRCVFLLAYLCEFFPECNQCFCEYLDIVCTIFGQGFVQAKLFIFFFFIPFVKFMLFFR